MTGFATADDVALTLQRTFTADEKAWVEVLLDQAAEYLRGVGGEHGYAPAT